MITIQAISGYPEKMPESDRKRESRERASVNTHSLPSAVPALIQFVYDIGTPADRAAGKGCCREDAVIR
ncbi:MAG: hypothetical protein MR581_04030, partial [Lachnospiraceae bacterium]|nr:hypothetical protein [Lachnospiraceae bacterium]